MNAPNVLRTTTAKLAGDVVFRYRIWAAPLVPIALTLTLGIVLDRYLAIPLLFSLLTVVAGLVAWAAARRGRSIGLPLLYLALAGAALGAAYHRWYIAVYAENDIGNYTVAEPRPVLLRGVLEDEPFTVHTPPTPLQSSPRADLTRSIVEVTRIRGAGDWLSVSGLARLNVAGVMSDLHAGDEVEVVGKLTAPFLPSNPGEFDYAAHLRDQRIRAIVTVQKTPDGVTRLARSWPRSLQGWLGVIRGWGVRTLRDALPQDESDVAAALLLGEDTSMSVDGWEKYIRTGVIHVLAISGQHLVVLAGFFWWAMRLLALRKRNGAWLIALFLLLYSLLAGGRPPVLRSAVMLCAFCGAYYLRRPVLLANAFALGWLVVLVLNPTDVFGSGCQLSFLAVAILYWGSGRWFQRDGDPLDRLVEETRPAWQRWLRGVGRTLALSYAVTLAIWLAAAPLVAARYHLVSPIGLVLGPPLVLLTAVALLAGFLLLLSAVVCWPLVPVFAWVTRWSLAACEGLVTWGDSLPGSHWYVGDVPEWWLWAVYLVFFALLWVDSVYQRWRLLLPAGLGWLCLGLLGGAARMPADELRCTFLAVGHGGCSVIETPDGRTLLYDAGAIAGPDVTRRQIAPFLWSRGIRRIDEILLSHADLDHFNGLPLLLERFAVGQVTCTPSFADKSTGAVRVTLAAIENHGVPVRIVRSGDHLTCGELEMDVLHPPATGPEGNENARSLVLLLRHAGHSLLLTGDLEGAGLDRVLGLPRVPIDIFMAPHHGSRTSNKPELAAWAQARVVIACEGAPRSAIARPNPYRDRGATYLDTFHHGAVTIRSHLTGLVVESFLTQERMAVRSRTAVTLSGNGSNTPGRRN
jgi:competence protein ComEC